MQRVSSENKDPAVGETPEGGENDRPTRTQILHSVTWHTHFTEAFFTVKMSYVSTVRV